MRLSTRPTCVGITLLVAITVYLTGCSDEMPSGEPAPSSTLPSTVVTSDVSANSIGALQDRAYELHEAIFSSKYEAAFDMRTSGCKAALPFDDFKKAVEREFGATPQPPLESLRFLVLTSQDGAGPLAYAQVQTYEVGQENNPDNEAPRRWKFEDGLWKFDNCGDEQ
ncbi:MAG: hypothetical protein C0482_14725 [Gordonia sp.]|uniref:Lipoprotein n=1 Tax=Gordonia rubripertincta TaxID=36822 RepID=A0ABT4MVY7_GORRU|nr:hypothetical protein [Gordonia rubripertincta]MBA4023611.1 hypothetical protein [Gordonia sp. (in: high G+C Gram-positive bacteria)]MCZ4551172.1 hypothetical protein [Gordonia rubripertincta]